LIEMIVGMVIMSIVMTVFTGAMILLFGSSNRTEAVARTSQQLGGAFTWLDRQVRYADYISQPTHVGDDWYVEFRRGDGTKTCYQLRVHENQLQQRSWAELAQPGDTWQPLATGVVHTESDPYPFTLAAASSASGAPSNERLTIDLATTQGSGTDGAQSGSEVTFAALNTDPTTPTAGVCNGGQS
jgi:hypothetical protein